LSDPAVERAYSCVLKRPICVEDAEKNREIRSRRTSRRLQEIKEWKERLVALPPNTLTIGAHAETTSGNEMIASTGMATVICN
jgi:hypothetical protein